MISRFVHAIVHRISCYLQARHGSIYIIFATAVIVIISALALGIGFSRTMKLESDYQAALRSATRAAALEFIRWRIDQHFGVTSPARAQSSLNPGITTEAAALDKLRTDIVNSIIANTGNRFGSGAAVADDEFCVTMPRLIQTDANHELLQVAVGFPQSQEFNLTSNNMADCTCGGDVPTGNYCQSVVSERQIRSDDVMQESILEFVLEASSQIRQNPAGSTTFSAMMDEVRAYLRTDWNTDLTNMEMGANIFGQQLVCGPDGDCGCTESGRNPQYGSSGCINAASSSIPTDLSTGGGLADQFRVFPMTMRVSMQPGRQCPEAQFTFSVEEIGGAANSCIGSDGNPWQFRRVHWYHSCASSVTQEYAQAQTAANADTVHARLHPQPQDYLRWRARYVGPIPNGNPNYYNLEYQARWLTSQNLYQDTLFRTNSDFSRPDDFAPMLASNTEYAMPFECTLHNTGTEFFSETEGGARASGTGPVYPKVVRYRPAYGTGPVGAAGGAMRCIPTVNGSNSFGSEIQGFYAFEPMSCDLQTGNGCCWDRNGNLNQLNPNCSMPIGYYELSVIPQESTDLMWAPQLADRATIASALTNGTIPARFEGTSPAPRWVVAGVTQYPNGTVKLPAPGDPADTYTTAIRIANAPEVHTNICSNCVANAPCPATPLNALGEPMSDVYTQVVVHNDKPIPPLQWHLGMVTIEGHRWRHIPDRNALDHFDNFATQNPQTHPGGSFKGFNVTRANRIVDSYTNGGSYIDDTICNGPGCQVGYRFLSEVPANDGTLNIHADMNNGAGWPEIPIGTMAYAENSKLLIDGNQAPLDFKVTALSCPEGTDSRPIEACGIGPSGNDTGSKCVNALMNRIRNPYATASSGMHYFPNTGLRIFDEGGHEPLASCQAMGCSVNKLLNALAANGASSTKPILVPVVSCPSMQCGNNASTGSTSVFGQNASPSGAGIPTRWSGYGNYQGGIPGANSNHQLSAVNCQADAANSLTNTIGCWNNQSARVLGRGGIVFPVLNCSNTDAATLLGQLSFADDDPSFGIADEYAILGAGANLEALGKANLAYTLLMASRPDLGRELNQGVAY